MTAFMRERLRHHRTVDPREPTGLQQHPLVGPANPGGVPLVERLHSGQDVVGQPGRGGSSSAGRTRPMGSPHLLEVVGDAGRGATLGPAQDLPHRPLPTLNLLRVNSPLHLVEELRQSRHQPIGHQRRTHHTLDRLTHRVPPRVPRRLRQQQRLACVRKLREERHPIGHHRPRRAQLLHMTGHPSVELHHVRQARHRCPEPLLLPRPPELLDLLPQHRVRAEQEVGTRPSREFSEHCPPRRQERGVPRCPVLRDVPPPRAPQHRRPRRERVRDVPYVEPRVAGQ
ncbi:unannotated protein [freshwater metagenome]|uniref:Unannotated protein n=1 Tax=freshwater metagenome TaxID=449393 RepID=A0A6J7QNQ9_9ZZZZ